jgi:hypothetical protein
MHERENIMPQARTVNVRETIDLVAPWYSQERLPDDGTKYRTFQRRAKVTDEPAALVDDASEQDAAMDDDDDEWVETLESARYKEHITVYRRASHGDAKWISRQANLFKGFNTSSGAPKINEAQMARMRTLGYLRRVVEITNAAGEMQPHGTEADFDVFDEPEMSYLDAAIRVLDDPVAPILHEDVAKAQSDAAKIADREARGFPVPADQQVDVPSYAAAEAQDRLFRPDLSDLPGASEQG